MDLIGAVVEDDSGLWVRLSGRRWHVTIGPPGNLLRDSPTPLRSPELLVHHSSAGIDYRRRSR